MHACAVSCIIFHSNKYVYKIYLYRRKRGGRKGPLLHNMVSMLSETNFTYKNFISHYAYYHVMYYELRIKNWRVVPSQILSPNWQYYFKEQIKKILEEPRCEASIG